MNIVRKEESVEGHWRRVCRELGPPMLRRGCLDSREWPQKGAVAFDATGGGTLAMDLLNSSTHEAALRNHHASTDTEERC